MSLTGIVTSFRGVVASLEGQIKQLNETIQALNNIRNCEMSGNTVNQNLNDNNNVDPPSKKRKVTPSVSFIDDINDVTITDDQMSTSAPPSGEPTDIANNLCRDLNSEIYDEIGQYVMENPARKNSTITELKSTLEIPQINGVLKFKIQNLTTVTPLQKGVQITVSQCQNPQEEGEIMIVPNSIPEDGQNAHFDINIDSALNRSNDQ